VARGLWAGVARGLRGPGVLGADFGGGRESLGTPVS
jgi:hypothetical protein